MIRYLSFQTHLRKLHCFNVQERYCSQLLFVGSLLLLAILSLRYMRGTAVTGDMYVYTTKKVTAQGETTATGTQQLEAWPGMNSGSSSSSKGIDNVGGAGG